MKALVTGGGGFLGTAICRALKARGLEVTSIARGDYPHLRELGVETRRADLKDLRALTSSAEGADVIFHVAAKAGIWGSLADYTAANVVGTQHVLQAARSAGVPRLVYTSSPSICFDGRDHINAGADLPLATNFLAHYPRTKALAEKLVLDGNSAELATTALRPHLIFGPGDPHILPRLVDRAQRGRLRIVGTGKNEVTLCFVDNAAGAHLQAAESLEPGAAHAGRAFFIGQEEPVQLWNWINNLLVRLGAPPVTRQISFRAAYRLGGFCEVLWSTLRLAGEPPMTRFVAAQLSSSHSYDMSPARRAFGYRPRVSSAEALERTLAAMKKN
ncbi:MAG: NAD-dependent epimerase/dehydratase family protein [bacterium]|nr:NAD-dependent epimerase/dehydratase family protein [Planctomycetota bacterium]HIL52041.1 NAD-dependent epimerase/dehydratase family protein [Planctomycetota bacterium]